MQSIPSASFDVAARARVHTHGECYQGVVSAADPRAGVHQRTGAASMLIGSSVYVQEIVLHDSGDDTQPIPRLLVAPMPAWSEDSIRPAG